MFNKLIVICGFLIIISTVFAKNISVPYCKADQLKIHELTCNYPGMMKTQTLYEIINVSHSSCRLCAGTPSIWAIDKNGRHILVNKNNSSLSRNTISSFRGLTAESRRHDILLNPAIKSRDDGLVLRNNDTREKVVWFSIEATAAYDPRKLPEFNKIVVALPGLSDKTFSVDYHGYTSGVLKITALQKSNRQDILKDYK